MEEEKVIHIEPEKMKLQKDFSEKLRIFFLFVKDNTIVPFGEQIGTIITYRPEDAVQKAIREYPGKNVFYQGQNITVEDLIKQIYLENGKIEINIEKKSLGTIMPPQKLSLEQFKAGLFLVLNEFLETEEDKIQLRKIIEKL